MGDAVPWPAGVNRSHAKIRAPVEQAMATLKTWRLLRKLRCSTTRITGLVQGVPTLHLACSKPSAFVRTSSREPRWGLSLREQGATVRCEPGRAHPMLLPNAAGPCERGLVLWNGVLCQRALIVCYRDLSDLRDRVGP
jgi:hypothetical protein